ncbi:1-phosphofructokinase family hexose kinase [Microbacterium murale]|uniref:Sugar kinase n=1 Tax=Microbacterium murale TaxID=1081040 RepID=A0ABQ1RFQ5_9MICO|nr:1-phosphofructokinase family hexose kinase [Microbacterium murale]GGD68726.1 sugar kinase [Microbacterium murale]
MILTVTANPALDLTWEIDRIEIGGTHRADTGAVRAGGKGLNVARVAHAQGFDVRALTTCGGATGAELRDELEASGMPHVLIPVTAPTRRSVAWVDRSLGDTTIVNERGVNPSVEEWSAFTAAVRGQAAAASVLVISGSFPPCAPSRLLPELIAAGAGRPVIVDTSGPALLTAADAGASVLKPNKAELAEATGMADPIDGARALIARGAGLVLLSLGAEGMYAVTADRVLRARLPERLAGNPTGAGDAAVAAAATLLAEKVGAASDSASDLAADPAASGFDPEAILRRATAWSAAAVLMPLAGEIHPTWRDLQRALILDTVPGETSPPTRHATAHEVSHAADGVSPVPAASHDPEEPA